LPLIVSLITSGLHIAPSHRPPSPKAWIKQANKIQNTRLDIEPQPVNGFKSMRKAPSRKNTFVLNPYETCNRAEVNRLSNLSILESWRSAIWPTYFCCQLQVAMPRLSTRKYQLSERQGKTRIAWLQSALRLMDPPGVCAMCRIEPMTSAHELIQLCIITKLFKFTMVYLNS